MNTSASSLPPNPVVVIVAVIGAPVLVTPTTCPATQQPRPLSPPSKFTHKPSSLSVRLLVKAHSTPPPKAQPKSSLPRRPKWPPLLLTVAPKDAELGPT